MRKAIRDRDVHLGNRRGQPQYKRRFRSLPAASRAHASSGRRNPVEDLFVRDSGPRREGPLPAKEQRIWNRVLARFGLRGH